MSEYESGRATERARLIQDPQTLKLIQALLGRNETLRQTKLNTVARVLGAVNYLQGLTPEPSDFGNFKTHKFSCQSDDETLPGGGEKRFLEVDLYGDLNDLAMIRKIDLNYLGFMIESDQVLTKSMIKATFHERVQYGLLKPDLVQNYGLERRYECAYIFLAPQVEVVMELSPQDLKNNSSGRIDFSLVSTHNWARSECATLCVGGANIVLEYDNGHGRGAMMPGVPVNFVSLSIEQLSDDSGFKIKNNDSEKYLRMYFLF